MANYTRFQTFSAIIVLLAICWSLSFSYHFITIYKSATRPIASIPSTSSRLHERCHGTFAPSKNIAIIGAGAAGASTAYHLRRFASPCQPLNVTIFERRHYVGGRSTTVNAYDRPEHPIELGASIFVTANHILVETAAELGLRSGSDNDERLPIPPTAAGAELGIWDGTRFRFVLPQDEPTWRLAGRLLWQYGTSPLRVQALMRQTVNRFLSMYQGPLFPFASLTNASRQASLLDTTSKTGALFLADNNVGEAYAVDIVQASTRVNYAQELTQLHALEAMVCMAAEGGAQSIQGGNWRIFSGMVAASEAHLKLETAVESIARHDDGTYRIRTNTSRDNTVFDEVVLAAPWQQASIDIAPAVASKPSHVDYVRLHVTLFASPHRLRPAYFGLSDMEGAPRAILTTSVDSNNSLPFFSISLLRAALNPHLDPPRPEFVYKIFSPAPVDDELLFALLDIPRDEETKYARADVTTWAHVKVWDAYPYLPPRTHFDGPELPFEDGRGTLYYTSGIESFISTMETSALSGRNVAKLLADKFEGQAAREGASAAHFHVQGVADGAGITGVEMERDKWEL